MNRSLERRRFPTTGVAHGELVLTTFHHPEYGQVPCPAIPLMQAHVHRLGLTARTGELDRLTGAGNSVMFTASYLDRNSNRVGMAVATNAEDTASHAAAGEVIESWCSALRTRRLLIAAADPLCAGARATNETITRLQDRTSETVHVVGVPGAAHGATSVRNLDEIPGGALVVLPAHGTPLAVRAEAVARGTNLVDTTCPLVQAVHADARRFADSGDHVVAIGRIGHAALPALVTQAPDNIEVVETADDVRRLDLTPDRVSYVVQPGMSLAETASVVAELRARYPHARGPHPDGFCYAATDRAAVIRAVADVSEIVLVLTAGDSPDHIIDSLASDVYPVTCLSDVPFESLVGIGTVGLLSTSSAKPGLQAEVTSTLSGLGPLSTVHQHFVSHVATRLSSVDELVTQ
jgi:4-hydroxy-3-methylbut-2-enyl diphosphate reductase